jgi:hypothetical protein
MTSDGVEILEKVEQLCTSALQSQVAQKIIEAVCTAYLTDTSSFHRFLKSLAVPNAPVQPQSVAGLLRPREVAQLRKATLPVPQKTTTDAVATTTRTEVDTNAILTADQVGNVLEFIRVSAARTDFPDHVGGFTSVIEKLPPERQIQVLHRIAQNSSQLPTDVSMAMGKGPSKYAIRLATRNAVLSTLEQSAPES